MFEARIFLAGPSRFESSETSLHWTCWKPHLTGDAFTGTTHVYIADAGLESFLLWFGSLNSKAADAIQSVVWCGDGDSLGKHGVEILKNTAARFEGRWREHFYSTRKDFSDCAALCSIIEYDLRHLSDSKCSAWFNVHGALGGRADHELANTFECVGMLMRLGRPGSVLFGPERVLSTAPLSLHLKKNATFSLMTTIANTQVHLRVSGALYSGDVILRQPSHGLSNVVSDERVVIEPLSSELPFMGIVT